VKYICHHSRTIRIDYRNKLKQTPLLLTRNQAIATNLIARGADVGCIDMNGFNAGNILNDCNYLNQTFLFLLIYLF
jgi:hypothetical protein